MKAENFKKHKIDLKVYRNLQNDTKQVEKLWNYFGEEIETKNYFTTDVLTVVLSVRKSKALNNLANYIVKELHKSSSRAYADPDIQVDKVVNVLYGIINYYAYFKSVSRRLSLYSLADTDYPGWIEMAKHHGVMPDPDDDDTSLDVVANPVFTQSEIPDVTSIMDRVSDMFVMYGMKLPNLFETVDTLMNKLYKPGKGGTQFPVVFTVRPVRITDADGSHSNPSIFNAYTLEEIKSSFDHIQEFFADTTVTKLVSLMTRAFKDVNVSSKDLVVQDEFEYNADVWEFLRNVPVFEQKSDTTVQVRSATACGKQLPYALRDENVTPEFKRLLMEFSQVDLQWNVETEAESVYYIESMIASDFTPTSATADGKNARRATTGEKIVTVLQQHAADLRRFKMAQVFANIDIPWKEDGWLSVTLEVDGIADKTETFNVVSMPVTGEFWGVISDAELDRFNYAYALLAAPQATFSDFAEKTGNTKPTPKVKVK